MKNFENFLFVLKTVLMSLVGQKRLPQTFSCAKNQKNFQNFWIFFRFHFPKFLCPKILFSSFRKLHNFLFDHKKSTQNWQRKKAKYSSHALGLKG